MVRQQTCILCAFSLHALRMQTCKLGVRSDLSQAAARVPWTEGAAVVVYPPECSYSKIRKSRLRTGNSTTNILVLPSPGTVPVQGRALLRAGGGSGGPPRGARPRVEEDEGRQVEYSE